MTANLRPGTVNRKATDNIQQYVDWYTGRLWVGQVPSSLYQM